jgi:hypothetical protein
VVRAEEAVELLPVMNLSRFGYGAVGLVALLGALALLFYAPYSGTESESDRDVHVDVPDLSQPDGMNPADESIASEAEGAVEETPEQRRASILVQWRAALLHHNLRRFQPLNRSIENNLEEFREGLMLVALKDPLPQPRAFAIRVLGKHSPARARDLFADRLIHDDAETVRSNSAWALGEAGATEDRELLESALEGERSEMVRKSIVEAISRLDR